MKNNLGFFVVVEPQLPFPSGSMTVVVSASRKAEVGQRILIVTCFMQERGHDGKSLFAPCNVNPYKSQRTTFCSSQKWRMLFSRENPMGQSLRSVGSFENCCSPCTLFGKVARVEVEFKDARDDQDLHFDSPKPKSHHEAYAATFLLVAFALKAVLELCGAGWTVSQEEEDHKSPRPQLALFVNTSMHQGLYQRGNEK